MIEMQEKLIGRALALTVTTVIVASALFAATPRAAGAEGVVDCATVATPPDDRRVFQPRVISEARYGTSEPEKFYVDTKHGNIYVEAYLPAKKGDADPPNRVPTIVAPTPYGVTMSVNPVTEALGDSERPPYDNTAACFTSHGYAYALVHLLGTGNSGGCMDWHAGPREVDSTLTVIEHIATSARWSDGSIGMLGGSYDATTSLATVASGDPRARHVKAVVSFEGATSAYGWMNHDGVPAVAGGSLGRAGYFGIGLVPDLHPSSERELRTPECWTEHWAQAVHEDATGDYTPYFHEREARRGAPGIEASILMFQGLRDADVPAMMPLGFFDRIPESTPHKLILGQWDHSTNGFRGDKIALAMSWFDRYLLHLETGAEDWPNVQINDEWSGDPDSPGRWRAEERWPDVSGKVGHLALGAEGALGDRKPSGAEPPLTQPFPMYGDGTSELTFTTAPLKDRLHLSGAPVLDLWVELSQPDARLAVRMEAFDDQGNSRGITYGWRSARHLKPIDDYFRQMHAVPPQTNAPVRIPVRLRPTEMVIPPGGWLRVEIGSFNLLELGITTPSMPAATTGTVTLLHNCEYMSALRFRMPERRPDLLRVEAPDGSFTEAGSPGRGLSIDGGGLASGEVCNQQPRDPQTVVASPN